MTISFVDMPSWVVVAVVSRIARHVQGAVARQGAVEPPPRSELIAVDDAIQAAEESARCGRANDGALELARKARKVAEDAGNKNQPKACRAALCAADAARAVSLTTDRQELVFTAQRALVLASEAIKPEYRADFEADIERVAHQGSGVMDSDPVPAAMLDFVYCLAVHEAGHVVAASLLGICVHEARIIYNTGVSVVGSPCDASSPCNTFSPEELCKYRLFYAAGAAAEDLVLSKRAEWGFEDDRRCHSQCGGTDFDADTTRVRQIRGFTQPALQKVAKSLEMRRTMSCVDIEHATCNINEG
jgi:hypothetical protein